MNVVESGGREDSRVSYQFFVKTLFQSFLPLTVLLSSRIIYTLLLLWYASLSKYNLNSNKKSGKAVLVQYTDSFYIAVLRNKLTVVGCISLLNYIKWSGISILAVFAEQLKLEFFFTPNLHEQTPRSINREIMEKTYLATSRHTSYIEAFFIFIKLRILKERSKTFWKTFIRRLEATCSKPV
ncbi:hypothetical protein J3Q64DRAFT_1817046 [Phycomyces blakesleeanus]|uniref:Uncharacterized protein n=1 Tax=Phycomyces blakesleeanus TaxID=4837 RepID=A0ABR3BCT6_PHYBL